jgi:hypothetical protein
MANLTVLLALHGEPGWIFLLCCNLDAVFSVLIRRWVTLKGPSSAITSRSPEEAMVDGSNAAAPSFSSSQTAQNTNAEVIQRELVIDQNGKVTETKVQKASSVAEKKNIENELNLAHFEFSPTVPPPPNSLSTDEMFFPGADLSEGEVEDHDEEREESETESLGRAIITTHISAQKMHNTDFHESFRHHPGDIFHDVDTEGKDKLGGIRVMIEQVVEVEYESDNGS